MISKITMLRTFIVWYRRLSIIIGIIIPILCYYAIPSINILNDPLSRFGIEPSTKFIWILFNQLMSLALLSIGMECNERITNKLQNKILKFLLYTSLACFSLSGFITMDIKYIHLTLAGLFFLLYIGYIFWYGIFVRIKKITMLSMLLVSICVFALFPTFMLPISYGSFEVVFILSLIIWNYSMMRFNDTLDRIK